MYSVGKFLGKSYANSYVNLYEKYIFIFVRDCSMICTINCLWYSYGTPMVLLWYSYGILMHIMNAIGICTMKIFLCLGICTMKCIIAYVYNEEKSGFGLCMTPFNCFSILELWGFLRSWGANFVFKKPILISKKISIFIFLPQGNFRVSENDPQTQNFLPHRKFISLDLGGSLFKFMVILYNEIM